MYKKKKLVTVRKALYWLIDRTKETELNALMGEIRCLGEEITGYFDLFAKVNSSNGQRMDSEAASNSFRN